MKILVEDKDGYSKMVALNESGIEIFHAEIFDFGNGGGDTDIFCPSSVKMTALEWKDGEKTLHHVSEVRHIAIDFKKE